MAVDFLEKKEVFDEYVLQETDYLSAVSFVHIFSWKEFFKFHFEIINRQLCIFASNEIGTFLYLPPLGGDIDLKTVAMCFERLNKLNRGSGVSRIENVSQRQLTFFPEENFSFYKKGYEYLYYKDDIIALKGKDYKSKRAGLNQFKKNYAGELKPFRETMVDECMRCYDIWATERKEKNGDDCYQLMLEENRIAHRVAMENYSPLGLFGRVVYVDGAIKGYTFGYPVNENVFCVLFEVAELSNPGLPVFIFHSFCADPALARYKFINVMDDFELPNIARTKMSYRPKIMAPLYAVKKKGF